MKKKIIIVFIAIILCMLTNVFFTNRVLAVSEKATTTVKIEKSNNTKTTNSKTNINTNAKTTTASNESANTKEKTTTETQEEQLVLTKLVINDFGISPQFSSDVYEYNLDLYKNLDKLEIDLAANEENATIEIIGNENLQEGENIITILLNNPKKEEYATYQIMVNKEVKEEQASSQEVVMNWKEPSTWNLKQQIIAGVAIAVFVILILLIIIKMRKSKKDDSDLDLPGAKELDRALTEHQEIVEDIKKKKLSKRREARRREREANLIEEIYSAKSSNNNSNYGLNEEKKTNNGNYGFDGEYGRASSSNYEFKEENENAYDEREPKKTKERGKKKRGRHF